MKKACLLLLFFLAALSSSAQQDSTHLIMDTLAGPGHIIDGIIPIGRYELPPVVIRAYAHDGTLLKTPAAIGTIGNHELKRFSNTSILPAVNTIPGVRMEERSPSSFRFGIRGSAAQSPFGVRNIKVYYNDIPFTDAGGNTYLNNLGFYNITGVEVIKGPASSLYGAGTGGAVLLSSLPSDIDNSARIHYTAGSFGLHSAAGEFFSNSGNVRQAIRYQHLESQGYREQSASRKDIFSWDAAFRTGEHNELKTHFLYTDLHYQTPGGLTFTQYQADPAAARPGTATIPGAVQQRAAIYQQAFLAGITNTHDFGAGWQNTTSLSASYNRLLNPNIRNYSRSSQPNVGARTTVKYNREIGGSFLQWIIGL